jgi:hypothetical protein
MRGQGASANVPAMLPSLLLAAAIASLFAVDARTRVPGDPRGPRYGAGFDPIAAALAR